ncbi:hypothetical protein CHS0354_000227 [Potamilus streckersoni]|uniref:FHA domain-containing protein n=1 Tax=Potamilus streckersoni TaxID=2493646 RepID=A0AAE0VI89_9BIVA|nr:hypothetical protein CHS0354_000227 [Potamilus streckersoni]
MVKPKQRHRTRSSDSDEDVKRKKHKQHKRSESPLHSDTREYIKQEHSSSRSSSPEPLQKMKPDPDRAKYSKSRYYGGKARDGANSRSYDRDRRHRDVTDRDPNGQHRDYDPDRKIKQEPQDDFESQNQERRQNDARRIETRQNRRGNPLRPDRHGIEIGGAERTDGSQAENKPVEKPNFQLSGKLTEDTNTYRGVVIKYNEPPEARKPKKRWRLYPFKNDEALQVLHIHRQSAYLIGRDRLVADIPVDHPSCSKQHAVLQYRMVDLKREDGTVGKRVAPYVIDLDSSNGTYVNNEKIEPRRYVELFERDVIKFGYSSRDFVLLHERSDTSEVAEAGEVGESP